jgi:hypothetical protein
MPRFTLVPTLRVHAASGPTLYPDESGFSAVWGEVESADLAVTEALDLSMQGASIVTLRCGVLEVTGTLDNRQVIPNGVSYRLKLKGLRYGSP